MATQAPTKTQASKTPAATTKVPAPTAKTTKAAPAAVDPDADPNEEAEAEAEPRIPYMSIAPKAILDGEGRLTQVPTDYVVSKHLKPKRTDFADESVYMEFKAMTFEAQAERLASRAKLLREQAETYRKFGDPATRSSVARAQRLSDQLQKLREQLAAEGVDVASLNLS